MMLLVVGTSDELDVFLFSFQAPDVFMQRKRQEKAPDSLTGFIGWRTSLQIHQTSATAGNS